MFLFSNVYQTVEHFSRENILNVRSVKQGHALKRGSFRSYMQVNKMFLNPCFTTILFYSLNDEVNFPSKKKYRSK